MSIDVLLDAIGHRRDDTLAYESGLIYADYVDDAGLYQGVSLDAAHHVSLTGLIVNPAVIEDQQRARRVGAAAGQPASDEGLPEPLANPDPVQGSRSRTASPLPALQDPPRVGVPSPTRLFASKSFDPVRMIRDASIAYDEIVQHFTAAGVPVTVHLEISSENLRELDPAVLAALRENLRQLGFEGRPE